MDRRTFGLRSAYSVAATAGGLRLPPGELARRLFGPVVFGGPGGDVPLRNGGRLYLEAVSHPQYATPDCGTALDLVVHDKAGERILEELATGAGQRLRDEGIAGDIRVFKRGPGPAGGSSGDEESYLIGRRGEFGRLADILIPFLVTRQLICGTGAVVRTPRGVVYGLSRWAGPFGNGPSPARSRPLITIRDDARAATAGMRRLRVTISDGTMSETTTLLKVGTGQSVTCPCRRRRSPGPTSPTTTCTAAAAGTTSCSAPTPSTGPRVTSTSSRRRRPRRPPAATGRRAEPARITPAPADPSRAWVRRRSRGGQVARQGRAVPPGLVPWASRGTRTWALGLPQPVTGSQPGPA